MAEKHELIYRGRKEIFINNLIGGIGWSFGAIIGTALLLGVLGLIAKNINFVPIVGDFVSNVVDYVITTNHNVSS
jgi:hypothetical protein